MLEAEMRGRVEPVKVRTHSLELRSDVLRGVGYRAAAGVDWHGPTRTTFREALTDLREHREDAQATEGTVT